MFHTKKNSPSVYIFFNVIVCYRNGKQEKIKLENRFKNDLTNLCVTKQVFEMNGRRKKTLDANLTKPAGEALRIN